jgi:hypothetical protein
MHVQWRSRQRQQQALALGPTGFLSDLDPANERRHRKALLVVIVVMVKMTMHRINVVRKV